MLLACPNCDARYDVPDNAIPENGRDVQCSNCGHAWFQMPSDAEEAVEDLIAAAGAEDLAQGYEPDEGDSLCDPDAAAPAEAISEEFVDFPPEDAFSHEESAEILAEFEDAAEDIADPEEPVPPPAAQPDVLSGTSALKAVLSAGAARVEPPEPPRPAPAPPVRRDLDESVLEILRDEAERETEARRAEAQRSVNRRAEAETGLQSQPELSMAPPTPELSAQQKRLAMLRGEDLDDEPTPPEPSRPMARRDLLPDVEEINSTLQPNERNFDPEAEIDALPDLTRGSFRSGFLLAMLVLIIASLVYIFAGRIVSWVPALESAMAGYVAFIDNLRNWLNSMMDHATQALTDDGSGGN